MEMFQQQKNVFNYENGYFRAIWRHIDFIFMSYIHVANARLVELLTKL